MAQQLWFLRHGEAEPHQARPDSERRLTARGERQASAAGLALARLGVEFSAAFTSPRRRALDTARLACASLGPEPIVHPPLGEGLKAGQARELAAGGGADGPVLVVGHEPDLSAVVRELTGARVALKKGGVVVVHLDDDGPELLLLLRPRELESLADVGQLAVEPAPAVGQDAAGPAPTGQPSEAL